MPELFHNTCKLFAGDSKLIAVIKNQKDHEILQYDLNKIFEWTKNWSMKLNYEKCKTMKVYSTKSKKLIYQINQAVPLYITTHDGTIVKLNEKIQERDLGIRISNNLKWKDHITTITNKAYSKLDTLKRTFKFWSIDSFTKLYTAYVRPELEFGAPV